MTATTALASVFGTVVGAALVLTGSFELLPGVVAAGTAFVCSELTNAI